MVEVVKEYTELVIAILSALAVILGLLAQIFKSEKLKKIAQKFKFYYEQAEYYVGQAEHLIGEGNGKQKLDWVVNQIRIKAEENKIDFNVDEVKGVIENLVLLTKRVNVNGLKQNE